MVYTLQPEVQNLQLGTIDWNKNILLYLIYAVYKVSVSVLV